MATVADYATTYANSVWETLERFYFVRDVVDRWAEEERPAMTWLGTDYEPTEELAKETQNFCRNENAPYKYPHEVEFTDQLPKTVGDKVRCVELHQREAARTTN